MGRLSRRWKFSASTSANNKPKNESNGTKRKGRREETRNNFVKITLEFLVIRGTNGSDH